MKLIEAFGLDASQIDVEALAHDRHVSEEAILAGRFRDDVVGAAREVVERSGGTLVIDIDDGGRNA
jgi:adenine deaminase